ncbi:UDP-N-acetylglucosamine--dolichyl-phosphate N-acetylglucosaminephosphotransferase-like protein [Leptotrombidium deliense]|uniref:UDP-N-acetylglucosamine--dolichyl-phosphate N-acetylglucosaminephosphotransferase n=1 Tax=Leptotrombidium deliense TaxID=299467 RepID=A0A443SA49_9ACAR|nr:UDP-N-acetylglucosamine--dolichyl-phosphate N-acetylglucosaminephosphotransferase-like protein [Leptotrombidium deliense]
MKIIAEERSKFLSKIWGIDKGRPGNVKVYSNRFPEAMGVISGGIYIVAMFIFIPIPFLVLHRHPSLPYFAFDMIDKFPHEEFASMVAALLSICCMLLLGFVDDILDLRWKHKLLFPAAAALPILMVYFVTSNVTTILLPKQFGFSINLGILYYIYMFMLAIFCTNAINIYAGINGLEAGQSVVIATSIIIYNIIELGTGNWKVHIFSLHIMIPFLAVTCALLYYNWYPAEVFVGDTFCYFAGMTFAVVGILGHFSKTMILFFFPQVFNFLLSCPQLFKFVPCPRHRLPEYDTKSGLTRYSKFKYRSSEISYLGDLFIRILRSLGLAKEEKVALSSDTYDCSNLTLINATLVILGPMQQSTLTIVLLIFQIICSLFAFFIRYILVKYFY